MTTGDAARLDVALVGGAVPRSRLDIHLRHYEASLTAALLDKFPACGWLLGGECVRDAARAYVRRLPPCQPCIAEYGHRFPQFLAGYGRAASLPYVESFAALEWAFGRASIATDAIPCSWAELAAAGAERLVESALSLQQGLHYCESRWRIDELMTIYLRSARPERFALAEEPAWLEIRGARGTVSLARLDPAELAFRSALAQRRSIGDAAGAALELNPAFDAGRALESLVAAGLVIGVLASQPEGAS